MRLEALHDERGVILAAIAFDEEAAPRPHPVAAPGQSVTVVDVPDEHADTPLDVLCTRFTVDVRRGGLTEGRVADEAT
jgi:hypothetical protein